MLANFVCPESAISSDGSEDDFESVATKCISWNEKLTNAIVDLVNASGLVSAMSSYLRNDSGNNSTTFSEESSRFCFLWLACLTQLAYCTQRYCITVSMESVDDVVSPYNSKRLHRMFIYLLLVHITHSEYCVCCY